MNYQDASLPVEDRVSDLLGRMTLEEKIGQLSQICALEPWTRSTRVEADDLKQVLSGPGVGSIYGVLRSDQWLGTNVEEALTPRQGSELLNAIQRFAIENTRLGIPLIFNEECSHGHTMIGATCFPAPISVGSTWNPALYEEMCAAIAAETRVQGATMTCSPVLDIARDPRWGRTEEMFGEDTYLTTRMAVASIRGLQGDSLATDHSIIATVKHFVHGTPEGGHNVSPAAMGERETREVYLKPFEAAIKAGAESVMSSYNEIDGVPCTASERLMTGILRDEWGFEGVVVSDMGAVGRLRDMHHVASDLRQAGIIALEAGVDIEMHSANLISALRGVRQGGISEEVVDRAVARVLRAKFLLGLFENPYVDPARAEEVVGCQKHRQLAREVARQGIVLLKNEDNLLPLAKDVRSIAVIGPNADSIYNQLGDYTARQRREKIATVLDGIRAKVSPGVPVRYAMGCGIRDGSTNGFAEAVEAAKNSQVAIVVVGGSTARYPERGATVQRGRSAEMDCGEGVDRATLDLSGVQLDLVKAVHATGVPTVVVLINGRPVSIDWIEENVPAIVEAWYPGEEGGNAVADVLFGDYCPGGKLPVSVPRSSGQLPVFYNCKPSARWEEYIDMSSRPLYPFGYGLSYTTFSYDGLQVTPDRIPPDGRATVTVRVTNTGKVKGDEVVQLYIRDEVSSITRPVKELKGFERITLEPGETRTVTFTIGPEELQFLDLDMKPIVEPGMFTIMVGGNSRDVATAGLEVALV